MMKKKYRKLLSFLTAVCCLAGSSGAAYASGGAVPRVVFENESDGRSDLNIGKEVENAEGCTADAEDRFTFTLTLSRNGGTLEEEQAYVLCDLTGKPLSNTGALMTQGGGKFTLKAGQMARFSDIPAGTDYVIHETPKDGYAQVNPPGGGDEISSKEGRTQTVIFRNLYDPGGRGEARLEIEKTFAFPNGYEAPQTPDFTFLLKLDGRPAAGLPYQIRDNGTGQITGSGTAGPDGAFVLKGGKTAVFSGKDAAGVPYIAEGMDYEVQEIGLPSGWRLTGGQQPLRKGGVNGTTVERFHNSQAAFVVTKRMEDFSTPDVDFRFELRRADSGLWPGADYYLYDAQKRLVRSAQTDETDAGGTAGEPDISPAPAGNASSASWLHHTREDGSFTLKPGQTAVFVGIAPGTGYSVSETADPRYVQVQPPKTEGYTGQEVAESIRTLPFVNQEAQYSRLLTVTKNVVNRKGDASDTEGGDRFRFILRDADGNPVEHALYRILAGGSERTCYTGPSGEAGPDGDGQEVLRPGELILRANETARFENLPAGVWQVQEIDLPAGYALAAQDASSGSGGDSGGERTGEAAAVRTSADAGQTEGAPRGAGASGADLTAADTRTAVLEEQGHATLTFTNDYWSDRADLQLVKVNPSGGPLADASFRLWRAQTDAEGRETRTEAGTGTTDREGRLTFGAPLAAGTWYVEETGAPLGYQVMEGRIKITVEERAGGPPQVTVYDAQGTALAEGADFAEDHSAKYTLRRQEHARDCLALTVRDEYLYDLPKTGGSGTVPYTTAGTLLMASAAYLYIRRRRTAALPVPQKATGNHVR